MSQCHFNGCTKEATEGSRKCAYHKRKGCCEIASCHNQVYRAGLCVRHGARNIPCSMDGCNKKVRVNGLCSQHAARLPGTKCSHGGCNALARGNSMCKRHCPDRPTSPIGSYQERAMASFLRQGIRLHVVDKYILSIQVDVSPLPVADNSVAQPPMLEGFEDMIAEIDWLDKSMEIIDLTSPLETFNL
ncbi:unnamed protein product [Aphanomyces euteiches]